MAKIDDEVRITLRLPANLRDRLTDETRKSGRSMNAEIVAQLEGFSEIDALRNEIEFLGRVAGHHKLMLEEAQISHVNNINDLGSEIRKLASDIDAAKRIIASLIEMNKNLTYDSAATRILHTAVIFILGAPLASIEKVLSSVDYEAIVTSFIVDEHFKNGGDSLESEFSVSKAINASIKETLEPILNYLSRQGWKLEPPADWPNEG